jgi:hypothetical protein
MPMKITVLIHRQTRGEPSEGTLRAWVVTPILDAAGRSTTVKGPNLLQARKYTAIDSAVSECDRRVLAEFSKGLLDAPQIDYIVEDDRAAGPRVQAFSNSAQVKELHK